MVKNCKHKGCKNKAVKDRTECATHRSRKYRKQNPMKAAFQNLRQNAKRRGHDFNLTFNEFEYFAIKTDYIAGKGIMKESYSIDRIDNEKGYQLGNIQILTNSQNAKKHTKKLEYDWAESKEFFVRQLNFHPPYKQRTILTHFEPIF
jgi:hypothetical protein